MLAKAAAKTLDGKTPEYHPGSDNQPPHYHAGLPQNSKLKHCSPYCFWDYTDFFKTRGVASDL